MKNRKRQQNLQILICGKNHRTLKIFIYV